MAHREQGPDCEQVEDWAGPGSRHEMVELIGGRERCFVAEAGAVKERVHDPLEGTCAVSLSGHGWGLPGPRQLHFDVWRSAVRSQIAEAQPLAAINVVAQDAPGGLLVAVVGECDKMSPCCSAEESVPEKQGIEAVSVTGSGRLRMLGAFVQCGGCGEGRSTNVYASVLSAKETPKRKASFASLQGGDPAAVRGQWPAAIVPEASLFAEHAATAIAAERRFDAERALGALEMLRFNRINFGSLYGGADGAEKDPDMLFDAVAAICAHHGVSCVEATRRDAAELVQSRVLGYRNAVVCRIEPPATFFDDGSAHLQMSLGCVVSYGTGLDLQETHVGSLKLSGDRDSQWLSGGPAPVQSPRLALGLGSAQPAPPTPPLAPAPGAESPELGL